MRVLCLCLCLCLLVAPLFAAGDPAVSLVLRAHPYLEGGGDNPQTFAAWANAPYLLSGAQYLGEVASFGPTVEAHLFISNRTPVLAAWAMSSTSPTIEVRLGRQAKLFAWGELTSALRGKTATLALPTLPVFVRGVDAAYVAEATTNALEWPLTTLTGTNPARQSILLEQLGSSTPVPLESEVEGVLGPPVKERLRARRTAVTDALASRKYKRAITALDALSREVEMDIDTALAKRSPETKARRFDLARRLLDFRLRLCEVRVGLARWQGQHMARQLSRMQIINLTSALQPIRAQAEPEGLLRGYPQTGRFAALAFDALERVSTDPAPREQAQLSVLRQYLPLLLAQETPSAWNLEITGKHDTQADGSKEVVLQLLNHSTEEARGTLQLALGDRRITEGFKIAPGGVGELGYALALQPGELMLVRLTGALEDGTPLPPHTLPIFLSAIK